MYTLYFQIYWMIWKNFYLNSSVILQGSKTCDYILAHIKGFVNRFFKIFWKKAKLASKRYRWKNIVDSNRFVWYTIHYKLTFFLWKELHYE